MENIPAVLVGLLMAVPGGKIGFLLLMITFLIVIGMTVDSTPACLIFTPLFLPVAVKMGMDPSHFIILMVCGFAIGLTTPPYGVCLFSVASLTKIPMMRLIKSALPFYAVLFITLFLVAFVPEIALFAPKLMGL
jgi:TRAP-type C4-dicarboxylate transport system permease large subunit